MFTSTQLSRAGIVATALLSSLGSAWTAPDLAVDLAWPPIDNEGYITTNGGQVVNSNPSPFPCAGVPVPDTASPRTDFPVSGAAVQLDFKNTSNPTQYVDWQFIVDVYLGQFGDSVTSDPNAWTYLSTSTVGNETGRSVCLDPVNITAKALDGSPVELNLDPTDIQKLTGADVTLGLRIVLFDGDNNQEEMYQCSYLKLVADDTPVTQSRGVCNTGPDAASPTSPPPSSTSTTTPNATSTPSNSGGKSPRTIGIAVGVTVGTALLLLLLGYILFRRRKHSSKPKGTLALGFWVAGRDEQGAVVADEKEEKKGKEKVGEGDVHVAAWEEKEKGVVKEEGSDSGPGSARGSVHSEPLPVYQPDLEGESVSAVHQSEK